MDKSMMDALVFMADSRKDGRVNVNGNPSDTLEVAKAKVARWERRWIDLQAWLDVQQNPIDSADVTLQMEKLEEV